MSETISDADLRPIVETLLFITDHPLTLGELAELSGAEPAHAESAVRAIQRDCEEQARAVQVLEVAEGFQMATRPVFAPFVRKLFTDKLSFRLSQAALETLSIIAYRQPITRAEIEDIRGVEAIASLESLLEKRLTKVVGRKEVVGRPLLYGTTIDFLRHFGLRDLEELPPLESFTPPPPEPAAAPAEQAESAEFAEPIDGAEPPAPEAPVETRSEAPVETPLEAPVEAAGDGAAAASSEPQEKVPE